jgi:hypothetical protein
MPMRVGKMAVISELSEREILVAKINNSYWWHVPPSDSDAYKKRGKFFASTFAQAEFYGRPNNEPERVNVSNPVYGFTEVEILEKLFTSEQIAKLGLNEMEKGASRNWCKKRLALDHKMYLRARELGYDAIVLMTSQGKKDLQKNRKPRSIELNLLL